MLVAGIDASTTSTGISIMDDGVLKYYTLINLTNERKDAIKRVKHMMVEICSVLDKYKLDAVYMEKAFNKSNIDTTIKLANLSGAVMFYCEKNNINFCNPEPSVWRAKIGIHTGRGVKREVLKAEAIKIVQDEYGIKVNDDVAESCLLARSAFDLPKLSITEDDLWS
jgi:Holliday junction resolvasome RuvABC endonuclease subunit